MNYYVILGIPVDADDEAIRRAFRALARRYHPDVGAGSSAEKFRQVLAAYETLRDPARRLEYDNSLRARPRSTKPAVEPLRAEPTRPEPTRAEPLRQDFRYSGDLIQQLFDELFGDLQHDPFRIRVFPRW